MCAVERHGIWVDFKKTTTVGHYNLWLSRAYTAECPVRRTGPRSGRALCGAFPWPPPTTPHSSPAHHAATVRRVLVARPAPGNSWQGRDDVAIICFREAHFWPFEDTARRGSPISTCSTPLCWLTAHRDHGSSNKRSTHPVSAAPPKMQGPVWQRRLHWLKIGLSCTRTELNPSCSRSIPRGERRANSFQASSSPSKPFVNGSGGGTLHGTSDTWKT